MKSSCEKTSDTLCLALKWFPEKAPEWIFEFGIWNWKTSKSNIFVQNMLCEINGLQKSWFFLNSKQHVAKTQNGIQGLCFDKKDHPNQLAENFKCFIFHHLFPEVKVFSDIPPADVHFWDDAACLKGLQELDIEEDGSKDGCFQMQIWTMRFWQWSAWVFVVWKLVRRIAYQLGGFPFRDRDKDSYLCM